MVQDRFGPPESLRYADVERPEPGPGEVVVRVRAAAVNPYDWHLLRGDPRVARLTGAVGLRRPKQPVAGIDVAGEVVAVGAGVGDLRPGDEVLGFCPGAFAEFARTTATLLVPRPEGLTAEEAAAVPMAATTALRALRDVARVVPGQRVVINGAAGGIGTFAVQIAVADGAEVTGVCSTPNVALVRSLGAAHVVDHTREDFTAGHHDAILDNVGNRSLRDLRGALTPSGVLLLNGGGSPGKVVGAMGPMLAAAALNLLVPQRLVLVPAVMRREDLLAVTALIAAGRVRPVVDRTYPLADAARALAHVETGHARGKVVLTVG